MSLILSNGDLIELWVMGVVLGIGLGAMLYLIGFAIGFIYKMFKF